MGGDREDGVAAVFGAIDWAATPLGAVAGWPAPVRAVAELVLASPIVASLAIGDDRRLIYSDAAARLYGTRHPAAFGRPLHDAFPDSYPGVAALYDRVFAGEAVSVAAQPLAVGTGAGDEMFDAYLTPVRGGDGTVLAAHMTGIEVGAGVRAAAVLRASEERQTFLLGMSDALRPLADPVEIMAVTSRMLGMHLRVGRCGFGEVPPPGDMLIVERDWSSGAMDSLRGRWRLDMFSDEVVSAYRAGRTLVIEDAYEDARTRVSLDAVEAIGKLRASVAVPLVKRGRLAAFFYVQDVVARRWSEAEVALVQDVAERTWSAVERARAEATLQASEERFRNFADASSTGLWIRDARTLAIEFINPAMPAIFGVADGVLGSDVAPWAAMVVPEERAAVLAHLNAAHGGATDAIEFRIRRASDGAFRWLRDTAFPLHDGAGIARIGGITEDITETRRLAEQGDVLLAELQHRVRNIMALIRSLANRIAAGVADVDDYRARLEARLLALARVQALLTRQADAGVPLREVLASEIGAQAHGAGQYRLDGPEVTLSPKTAEVLTLAFHELATNAVKYGALAVPDGRLAVGWSRFERNGARWLALTWRESGGPPQPPPTRRGFGSELIEARLPYELGGRGTLEIAADGARCTLEFPLRREGSILETIPPPPPTIYGGTLDMTGSPDLSGHRVLVIEDDYYMAHDTATALRGAGAEVLGPCPTEAAATELLARATPTHAVLDLNLGGAGPRFAIAGRLRAAGVPFVFLTGYDPDVIPGELADVPRLEKPVAFRAIVDAVARL